MVEAFSFDNYICNLDANQKKNWRRDLTYFALEDTRCDLPDDALSEPREAITGSLLDLICTIERAKVLVAIKKVRAEVSSVMN
jgi:hypothetical protein